MDKGCVWGMNGVCAIVISCKAINRVENMQYIQLLYTYNAETWNYMKWWENHNGSEPPHFHSHLSLELYMCIA